MATKSSPWRCTADFVQYASDLNTYITSCRNEASEALAPAPFPFATHFLTFHKRARGILVFFAYHDNPSYVSGNHSPRSTPSAPT